jgi:hypothetical protein
MVSTILTKCLDELGKDKPDLSYIRGMIEVLLASQPQQTKQVFVASSAQQNTAGPVDEGSILDAKARAALETVKKLGGTTI